MAILDRGQWFCEQVHMLRIAALLDEEVRYRRSNLQAGRQRARALWIMRRDWQVVSFRHSGNQPKFGDAARVAYIGLKDHRRLLLKNFSEAPLGKNPLTRGQWDVRFLSQFCHYIDIQRLNYFFIEP